MQAARDPIRSAAKPLLIVGPVHAAPLKKVNQYHSNAIGTPMS
jgi:hypothetical protein